MAGGRPRKDSVPINLRLDRKTADRLDAYAARLGQTRTLCIERIINQFIDEQEKKEKQLADLEKQIGYHRNVEWNR